MPEVGMLDYRLLRFAVPAWNTQALDVIQQATDKSLLYGLRSLMRRPVLTVDWLEGRSAQDLFFGPVLASHHAFSNNSLPWLKPSEPQITQGWGHFLASPSATPEVRLSRQVSFIQAVFGTDPTFPLPKDGDTVSVVAEFPGRYQGRERLIDLVLSWQGSSGRPQAVAVEFKFKHKVAEKQLSDYYQIMRKLISSMTQVRLAIVIADERSYPLKKRRSKNWQVVSWRDLLRRIEVREPDHDASYSGFRHMAWRRAGH